MRSGKQTCKAGADALGRRLLDREEELARLGPLERGGVDRFVELMSAETLESLLRPAYEAGHPRALISAIELCAYQDKVMPDWIKGALGRAVGNLRRLEVRRWEDVFGTPLPRGTHADALLRRRELASTIFSLVQNYREIGMPIAEGLFDEIAGKLTALEKMGRLAASHIVWKCGTVAERKGSARISGTTVAQMYYDEKRRLERISTAGCADR